MIDCERWRPLISRMAEGELGPEEAILAARHLADCTACRILLARERRLARMLTDDLEDRLPVGEEFVSSVMATLPQDPPPRRRRRRKHLKLAGLAALVGGISFAAARGLPFRVDSMDLSALPRPALEQGPESIEGWLTWVRATISAVETLFSWLPSASLAAGPELTTALAVVLVMVVLGGIAAGSGGLALFAAGSLLRIRRRARVSPST